MANRETEILRLDMKQKVNVATLKPNETNPRYIKDSKFKKLVKSIKEFPEMMEKRPIVVDEDMVILGGNMRFEAAKAAGLFEVWIDVAEGWTEEKKREFIVKDNVGFGEWDWDILGNDWAAQQIEDWGLDIPQFVSEEDFGTDFDLPDGDKSPFQQQTYTLSDEQAEVIKNAIADAKKLEEFKYVETYGNENSNGNALYYIIAEWISQKS
jgi:hypothetical protein